MPLSRRQFFRVGGLAAAAAPLLGMELTASPGVAAAAAPSAPRAAGGSISSSAPLIPLNGNPTTQWPGLTDLRLNDPGTGPQALAFDDVHGQVYVLQVAQGGTLSYTQSAGTTAQRAPYGRREAERAGDLCLTRLDLTGRITGVMYLLGFGHGVSLGVEPAAHSPTVHIWTECQAQPTATSSRGNLICRFPFTDGGLVTSTDVGVTRFDPVPGARNLTPSVDVHGTDQFVTVRYSLRGAWHFSTWDLPTAVAHGFSTPPLASRPQPAAVDQTVQGWTTYGRYLYLLDGSRGADGTWSIRLTSADLDDARSPGTALAQSTTVVDAAAVPREPQGLAVCSAVSPPRLAFMVRDSSTTPITFDIAYKDAPA